MRLASLKCCARFESTVATHECSLQVLFNGVFNVARFCVTNAAFQSPRANGAHDFEVGKIPVQPYVAFHSLTEPRWLIVLSCSFLLCLLLALFNSVNRVFVLQRTHALHTCSYTSLTQQRINLKPTHRAYQHST